MIGDDYTCARCGETFAKTVTDADAMDEALDTFPAEQLAGGLDVVCNDCFTEVMTWTRINAPELLRGAP